MKNNILTKLKRKIGKKQKNENKELKNKKKGNNPKQI